MSCHAAAVGGTWHDMIGDPANDTLQPAWPPLPPGPAVKKEKILDIVVAAGNFSSQESLGAKLPG
jgi:hypothetical protein